MLRGGRRGGRPGACSPWRAGSAPAAEPGAPPRAGSGGGSSRAPCTAGQGQVDGTFATRSSFGPAIDRAAPGVCEIGASATRTGVYAWGTGTSFATPYVSGAAALYRATHPTATPSEVRAALIAAAKP